MRISFERTGGFAGVRVSTSLDVANLPNDEAEQIRELLSRANFRELPERLVSAQPVPDQFEYSISVEAEGWQHTIVTSDLSAPADLRPLIQLLNRLAKTRTDGK